MPLTTYADVLARNIVAARNRLGLDQANVVARMRALGYDTWHRQTMGKVERGERRVTVEEMLGLSLAVEVPIGALMAPADQDKVVELPSGESLSVAAIQMSAHGISESDVTWEGDTPVFIRGGPHPASWQADTSYIRALQQARRRRAWEQLPEEEQAAKLEASLAMGSGASGEELADLPDPGVKLAPLGSREDLDTRLRAGEDG